MRYISRFFIVFSTVATLLVLAGCGAISTPNASNAPTTTPTASLPGSVSPTTTSADPVTLHPDALLYQIGDTISITLSNQSNQTIYFPDHLTSCTVLLLQRQKVQPLVSTNGQPGINLCTLKTPTLFHSLAPKQQLVVKLAPPKGGWPSGLYHAVLSYRPSPTSTSITTIQSPVFTISSGSLP